MKKLEKLSSFCAIALLVLLSSIQLSCPGAYGNDASKKNMDTASTGWEKLGIIDIHAHIGSFKGYDISKSTLLANVRKYGIKTALVSNIDCADLPGVTADLDEELANAETVKFVNEDPQHFRGVLWVRPHAGKIAVARKFLEMHLNSDSSKRTFVAMKFHPEFDHYHADDKSVDSFMTLCAEAGLPAVFHCGAPGSKSEADRIYNVAKRFPKVPVVLYHMGFNSDHVEAISCATQAVKNNDANLYLETSQCSVDAVLAAIKRVGARHVLFGTDATYYGKEHYQHYQEMITRLKQELSPADFNLVVRENAQRIFAL